MEATMGRKSSVVEVVSSRCPMNLDKEAAMQHYVGTDPIVSVVWSQANVPVSACSIASYDHSLKRSEDSVMSCETGNSSPMVFSHSLEYPETFYLQKSYPSSTTTSTQSFTVSIESSPHEELHDGFIASNSHTQHTEQISHIYPYSEYMAPDHIVGSMDHQVFNSLNGQPAGGVVSSEQSPLSNWHSKIITGFVHPLGSHTVSWEPQFSVAGSQSTEMNFVDISMVTDESNDQGFHLSHPRKRSSTSDEDEELYHLAKKTSWPFNSADSKCQKLKPKAKKISATDPQSVAARHRRERISERLKILQELIPNGSKVDLVTMLEKAINYVKFLQLQVKVLTTDEYWPTQDGALPNIDKVKEALQALTSTRASVDTDGTSSSSSELGKKSQSQDKSKSAASHDKSVKKVQNQTQCTSASPC